MNKRVKYDLRKKKMEIFYCFEDVYIICDAAL